VIELMAWAVAAGFLGAAGWLWSGQWRAAQADRPGHGGIALATRTAFAPSTRTTVALAAGAGIIGSQWLAARGVEGIAWMAGVTGLDAAAWAPASADAVFLAVLAAMLADVVVIGLCRVDPGWLAAALRRLRLPALLDPALRHSIIGLLLPAVLVAGAPLLVQTGADATDAIAAVPAPAVCAPAELTGDTVAGYGPDRLANAATIVQVGQQMGVPERGQLVALATAMQESGLRNLDYGDRDSLGLFQQRPSQGWGSRAQVTDPVYAAGQFYAHLKKIRDYWKLPVWQAAQAVQRSGFPTAYAKHEHAAAQVLGAVAGTTCTTTGS
jgi:hypothetical protein